MRTIFVATGVVALMLLAQGCGDRSGPSGGADGPTDAPLGEDSAASDGSGPRDAGVDAAPPDGASPDGLVPRDSAALDAGWRGVLCGFDVCTTGSEVCCVAGSAPHQECTEPQACSEEGPFAASCDGPEDCNPGEKCCMPGGIPIGTFCRSTCGSPYPGETLCHSDQDCSGAGQLCCPSHALGWDHRVCISVGPVCPP